MDYFKIGKYQLVEENVLYTARILYDILEQKKHIDELFEEYSEYNNIQLSLNVEKTLFLSLIFLFSLGKIKVENNLIVRE